MAIVSDSLAAWYWPGESPIGKRFLFGAAPPGQAAVTEAGRLVDERILIEVVGVTAGLRNWDIREAAMSVLMPREFADGLVLSPLRSLAFFVSSDGDNEALLVAEIRRAVAEVFPEAPLLHLAPMQASVAAQMTEPLFYTTLLTLFAAYGLLLSLVGIIGVVHYQTSRRQREMAVRMVLGAHPRDVVVLLGTSTLGITAAGVTVGLFVAAGLARLIESALFVEASLAQLPVNRLPLLVESPLFGVTALDPWNFVVVPVAFIVAAVAAALMPARRVASLELVDTLRLE